MGSRGRRGAGKVRDGWFLDPFLRHHDRFFAQGRPTELVRDGLHESFDPPPELLLSVPLVPVPVGGRRGSEAIRQGGDGAGQSAFDPRAAADRATSAMVRYGAAR